MIPLDLVPLSADEAAHEARVVDAVRAAIARAGGWLSFASIAVRSTLTVSLGYYAAGAHKFGAGGDFVTAPEVSPVFALCIATQCAQVLDGLGEGEILEIGAGSGALAADVLVALAGMGALPGRYRILETSPDLRARQAARLGALPEGLGGRVEWLDAVPAAPFAGVLLANEVLDALPVERFRVVADGIEEIGVAVTADGFALAPRPAGRELTRAVAELGVALPEGYGSEACLRLGAWLRSVTAPLARGAALFIDYGLARRAYYAPDRDGGTFACFHRHRRHEDPFVNVGLQDLTAWVDFTRVAEAALACGFEIAGYTTQANFLLGTGFERHLLEYRASLDAGAEPLAARRAMKLVLPAEMGERFKAMALVRDYDGPLAGFSLRDFTATL